VTVARPSGEALLMRGLVCCYFAYGSNMNPERVRDRGLAFDRAEGARLPGYALRFEKSAPAHAGSGHANLVWDRDGEVEGVLYWLVSVDEIRKMDPYERTPVNYSREVVVTRTQGGTVPAWTYFANPGVLRPGLRPDRAYLAHLLAATGFLSKSYAARLRAWPCVDEVRG
jgi:hypothetical protein